MVEHERRWTRARRRRLVVATFAAVVVCEALAALALAGWLDVVIAGAIGVVPFAAATFGALRIFRVSRRVLAERGRGTAHGGDTPPDGAHRSAYRLVAAAWVMSLAYGLAAGAFGLPIPTRPPAYAVLLLVTVFLTVTLPDAIGLWTAPDATAADGMPDERTGPPVPPARVVGEEGPPAAMGRGGRTG